MRQNRTVPCVSKEEQKMNKQELEDCYYKAGMLQTTERSFRY